MDLIGALIGAGATLLAAVVAVYLAKHLRDKRLKHPRRPKMKRGEKLYEVEGDNGDGSDYSGIAYISRDGDQIRVRYFIGGEEWSGEGQISADNQVTVQGTRGDFIARYELGADGVFRGEWGGSSRETMTPLSF